VTGDREEPNRVLGFPIRTGPPGTAQSRTATDPGAGQGEEQQRVLGLPADLFDTVGERLRAFRLWMFRRRGHPEA
jgi:hypothetical protein